MSPGDVVTASLSGGVGAEKDKERPVLVIHQAGPTTLVVAVTDARKTRLPTHRLVKGFDSGTTVKDALVTCEHAWFVDLSRLAERPGARALVGDELTGVGRCMRVALGLAPSRPPPQPPAHKRGAMLLVEYSGGVGVELTGVHPALVLSNDAGNYFGRTLLVAPWMATQESAILPVSLASGTIDLGRLRVVDLERVRESDPSVQALPVAPTSEELAQIDARLATLVPW